MLLTKCTIMAYDIFADCVDKHLMIGETKTLEYIKKFAVGTTVVFGKSI